MGTWGPGLYSNDIAKDLKSTITAVARLPFNTDELVDIIASSFPEAANDSDDDDYTTFWLVLADQFHRKGISHPDLFHRAMDIVDSGKDLNAPSITEMGAADQRKREKALNKLRNQLTQPAPPKTRKTLSKPQPLILKIGDVVTFPIVEREDVLIRTLPKHLGLGRIGGPLPSSETVSLLDTLPTTHQ